MALTKVTKTGISDNSIDADKIEDGTVVAADLADGAVTAAKLPSTLDFSSKTVTLPNTSVTNDMLSGSIANAKLANSSITVNGSSVSLGGSVSAGKVQWQTVKTTDFNAVAGEGYFVDTNSVGAVTATLPGSPSAGDTIAFKDYAANFGTNALTIARNGNNIQGVANNSEISTNRASIVLVYIDATKGWLFTNESNVADLQPPQFISATGGTITTSGDYKIHTFTGDGCFVVATAGSGTPVEPSVVDYLVVAGGGGGGSSWRSGGGGAGGYREAKTGNNGCHTASPLATPTGVTLSATTYPITVGSGGAGSSCGNSKGTPGSNSIFSTITSAGGGGGGAGGAGQRVGLEGGSGGGGGSGGSGCAGGAGNTPPVSPPQGSPGGFGGGGGISSPNIEAAGGGGAGATGTNATPTAGGTGGDGAGTLINPATGVPGPSCLQYYAGGGGAPGNSADEALGGGGKSCTAGQVSGDANSGGGGAGNFNGGAQPTGSGGKGIVVIRYKFQN